MTISELSRLEEEVDIDAAREGGGGATTGEELREVVGIVVGDRPGRGLVPSARSTRRRGSEEDSVDIYWRLRSGSGDARIGAARVSTRTR